MERDELMEHEQVVGPKMQKRAQLSGAIKQDLCDYKRQAPQATQEQIADYVYQKFGIKINRSTVAKILKASDKWLSLDTSDLTQANKKRMRAAKHQGLEASLWDWYDQECQAGVRPSDNQVIARAIDLAADMGINESEFKASQGWLANFKKRYNIRPRHPMSEQPPTIVIQHHPHPQGVPPEALHAAEAHAALAQAHLLPTGLEQFQTHALHIHYARLGPGAGLPQLAMPELGGESEEVSNKTAHLCAQQVRMYILKNPHLFCEDSLKSIEEIIEKIGRNACYGQIEPAMAQLQAQVQAAQVHQAVQQAVAAQQAAAAQQQQAEQVEQAVQAQQVVQITLAQQPQITLAQQPQ